MLIAVDAIDRDSIQRRYGIVYRVDRTTRTVAVVAIGHRRTIYEEALAQARFTREP